MLEQVVVEVAGDLVISPTGQPWHRADGPQLSQLYTLVTSQRWAMRRLHQDVAAMPREAVTPDNAAIAPPLDGMACIGHLLIYTASPSARPPGPLADALQALATAIEALHPALHAPTDWTGNPATAQPGRLVTALTDVITALDAIETAVLELADADTPHPEPIVLDEDITGA